MIKEVKVPIEWEERKDYYCDLCEDQKLDFIGDQTEMVYTSTEYSGSTRSQRMFTYRCPRCGLVLKTPVVAGRLK